MSSVLLLHRSMIPSLSLHLSLSVYVQHVLVEALGGEWRAHGGVLQDGHGRRLALGLRVEARQPDRAGGARPRVGVQLEGAQVLFLF